MKAWHFVNDTLRDGRPVPDDGKVLRHEGEIAICESGLHASKLLIDALKFAPGNTICRVECRDVVDEHDNKFVCRERVILWRVDGEQLLRRFACNEALRVLPNDADPIIRQYLKTQDESIRRAAYSAAHNAAHRASYWAADCAADCTTDCAPYSVADSVAQRAAGCAAYWATDRAVNFAANRIAYRKRQNQALTSMVCAERRRNNQ